VKSKSLGDIIPIDKLELLKSVYDRIKVLEDNCLGEGSLDTEKIKYTDDEGIKHNEGPFLGSIAVEVQRAIDGLLPLVRGGTLSREDFFDIKGRIVIGALTQSSTKTPVPFMRAIVKDRVKVAHRPADTAFNVLLYLLVLYAKFYDNGKKHFQEIADFLDKNMFMPETYETVRDSYRKLNTYFMEEKYWLYCRVSCGLEPETGYQETYTATIPTWDSLICPDQPLNYDISLQAFVKKLQWCSLERLHKEKQKHLLLLQQRGKKYPAKN
jgi:hypothetical protein